MEFTFPEVMDTGSVLLGDPTGQYCGSRTYSLQKTEGFIYLKPGGNSRELIIGTDSNAHVGIHSDVFMLVAIGIDTTALVPIPIEIGSCETTGLELLGAPLTAFVLISLVPSTVETDFPVYAKQPTDCPYNEDDFIYTLDGKDMPDWIYLDHARKKIKFEPTDTSLTSEGYSLELTIDYQGF